MAEQQLNDAFKSFFKEGEVPTTPDTTPDNPRDRKVKGKIIKISGEGWGFISSRDIKFTRIFFHWTALRQDTLRFEQLRNGMKVEFTPTEHEGKGWRAIKIRVLKEDKDSQHA
jgi:cold shock CspA family protein